MSDIPSVETIEYGRRVLKNMIERYEGAEAEARANGDDDYAHSWHRLVFFLRHDLYGYEEGGCTVTPFDKRWLDPAFRDLMTKVRQEANDD